MRKYIIQGVCFFLIALTVAFIFYNSAQSALLSGERSENVAESISPKPKEEYEKPADWNAFVRQVRKAAHAVEFFALGLELAVLFLMLRRKTRTLQAFWNTLSVALAVAVADESVQILSRRGSRVQDVLLDFCGATCAILLVSVMYFSVRAVVRHKKA